MLPAFHNEALTDFSVPENEAAFQVALERVKAEMGKTYPLVIGGEKIKGEAVFASTNPSISPSMQSTSPLRLPFPSSFVLDT